MPQTPYTGWNYPEENQDPHYDTLQTFFNEQDDTVYGLMNSAANIILPPGSMAWAQLTAGGTLSWTGNFEIPLLCGFSLYIQFAPDGVSKSVTLNDGDRLVVSVPRTASGIVNANFKVVNGAVTFENGLITVGFVRGNKFHHNLSSVM